MDQEIKRKMQLQIDIVTELLYSGDVAEGMAKMQDVIPQLAVLLQSINNEELERQIIEDVLKPALNSMEERDGTTLADILQYELLPLLEAV